jgi:hypothetical protein
MARTSGRSEQEIEQLLNGYEAGGLTRRQYCEQQGIAVTALDYYRRSRQERKKNKQRRSTPLVKVELTRPEDLTGTKAQQAIGFTLVLAKGRRIESGWNYAEPDLARLIRVVEAG